MSIQELKAELEKRLTEIKLRIKNIQDEIDEKDALPVELENILIRLKAIQEDLILQHDQLDAMEEEGETFNELERNIWSNLESFDSKFSEAGSMMKGSKFRTRERSVDFKNPFGNK